jgi:hypothetical protein
VSEPLTIWQCPKCERRFWAAGYCPEHRHPTIPAPRLEPESFFHEEDVCPLWEAADRLTSSSRTDPDWVEWKQLERLAVEFPVPEEWKR